MCGARGGRPPPLGPVRIGRQPKARLRSSAAALPHPTSDAADAAAVRAASAAASASILVKFCENSFPKDEPPSSSGKI